MTDATVVEPLTESAALARELAREHCRAHADGASCRAYHGFWQYLRLMGLGKTLSGMPGRYLAAIGNRLAQPQRAARPEFLISGCADYSALAHVLHACRASAVDARVTALDRCYTPLALNAWYAQRCGAEVRTVAEDILDHREDARYDLIVTSSFLGYFEPAARPRLFRRYAALLRPQGALIFANRLRVEDESVRVGFAPAEAARFAERAAQLSGALPPQAALAADEARQSAAAYAGTFASYPVNSEARVRALAADAGLEWVAGEATASRRNPSAVAGPTMSDGADYLFVTLGKP